MANKVRISAPKLFNIDTQYKNQITILKEKVKEGDTENVFNVLDYTNIYILAIAIAVKNKLKPQKSKKSHWLFRTDRFANDKTTFAILKSLIYDYNKQDLKILFPEESENFYLLCEQLANAGMEKAIELLEKPEEIEALVVMEAKELLK
jgi:hypothetical protein